MSDTDLLIAVDGGGTGCRVAVASGGQRFEAKGGPANMTSNPEAGLSAINNAIVAAVSQAGLTRDVLKHARAYLALAGVLDAGQGRQIAARFPFAHAQVSDDREAAVVGAHGASDGAIFAIGTGSFVARQTQGTVRAVGGWGLNLGDEASGAYIGRDLLRRTLRTIEEPNTRSDLTQATLDELGGRAGVIRFAGTASPPQFAELAPRIVAAAGRDDPVAGAIMTNGVRYIERSLKLLGWKQGERLCAVGGLAPHYAQFLAPGMARSLVEPAGTVLDGALALAADLR